MTDITKLTISDFTKNKIKEACALPGTTLSEYAYLYDDAPPRIEITDNGDIIAKYYEVVRYYNCGCFGCSIETIEIGSQLIGSCDNLAFLDNY